MEALAAIALAGNILQFAETTKHLISSTHQLSHLGANQEHIELSTIARELQNLMSRVTPLDPPAGTELSEDEKSIRALGLECNHVAQELLGILYTLKKKHTKGTLSHFDSFYRALLSEWKKEEVDALRNRLDLIATNIDRHLAAYDSKKILQRVDELSAENHRLDAHRSREITELGKQFRDVFNSIGDKLQENESRNRMMATLLSAAAKGSRYSAEQVILEHLRFDEINDRRDTICEAHEQTFSWLFDTGEQHSPATFDDWLSSSDDVYWISGKPGSGKSTLMKFLYIHTRTIEKLKIWAEQKRLVSAGYFFWNAGKRLQKSQEGLLRSLIYQLLRQCPDMIPQVYPNAWRLLFPEPNNPGQAVSISETSSAMISLSVQGLLETLRALSSALVDSEAKFCFFIDGLDEGEDKPNDMIESIRRLRKLPNLKLCLSSRPWNEFEEEFGKDCTRKLYMQDFNSQDISAYVYDTFANDENYQELEDKELPGEALIKEIVKAANGVFLWVFLVVRSFQEGLKNGDRVLDLNKRLQLLPTDLNDYFKKIVLSDVGEFYHGHSAEMFIITLEASEDLPLIAYWFTEEDVDYVLKLDVKPLSIQQVNKRIKDTKKRLNASCKGLLEVRHLASRDEQNSLPSSILFNWKVGFLHRTVREFLVIEDTRRLLRDWSPAGFEPHETICKILLAQIKTSPEGREYYQPVSRLYYLFQHHYHMKSSKARH